MLLKLVNSISNTVIEHDGYTHTLRGWANFLNIPYDTLRMRYTRGLRGDELFKQVQWREDLDTNAPNALSIEYMGETHSLASWARKLNLSVHLLYNRHRNGKRGADLFLNARLYAKKLDKKVV